MALSSNSPTQLLVIRATITDAATANYDYTVTRSINIVDAAITKGPINAAGVNTVQLQNGLAGIIVTDAMNGNQVANTIIRALVVDNSTSKIGASQTLRYAVVKGGGDAAYDVITYCIPS